MSDKPQFTIKDVVIHEKKRLFKEFFAIDEYKVSYKKFSGGETPILRREIFERDHDAVAILPYDPKTNEVILIEQFRPGALKDPVSPWLIEIVAGIIDEGETEMQAAIRELKEEANLQIREDDLHYINAVYPSPGGISEKVTLYWAYVDSSHLSAHGGLEVENEDIRIFKVPVEEAFKMCRTGRINNAACLISLMYLELNLKNIKEQ